MCVCMSEMCLCGVCTCTYTNLCDVYLHVWCMCIVVVCTHVGLYVCGILCLCDVCGVSVTHVACLVCVFGVCSVLQMQCKNMSDVWHGQCVLCAVHGVWYVACSVGGMWHVLYVICAVYGTYGMVYAWYRVSVWGEWCVWLV